MNNAFDAERDFVLIALKNNVEIKLFISVDILNKV